MEITDKGIQEGQRRYKDEEVYGANTMPSGWMIRVRWNVTNT